MRGANRSLLANEAEAAWFLETDDPEKGGSSGETRVPVGEQIGPYVVLDFLGACWSADGQSLFVTSFSPTGSSLLRVTLDGRFWVLLKAAKDVELPRPSPDGRSLAFSEIVSASNVWLLEGFLR